MRKWLRTIRSVYRNKPRENSSLADFLLMTATTVVFFLFCNLLLTAILFFFGLHIHIAILFVSIFFTVLFSFFWNNLLFYKGNQNALSSLFVIICVFVLALGFAGNFVDISYDGQTYHQEAIIRLSEGWNPFYEELDPSVIGRENRWVNFYPKSAWINASYFYILTGNIQAAKGLSLVLVFVAIAFSLAALLKNRVLSLLKAIPVVLLLAFSPVVIYQSLSFYVDIQVISLLVCLASILYIVFSGKRDFVLFSLLFVIPILVNVKFTAVVYGAFLIAAFLATMWMQEKILVATRVFLLAAFSALLSLFVIGFNPYFTNTVNHGHPLYPLGGKQAVDLKPYNTPGTFSEKPSYQIFFLSFFTKTGNIRGEGTKVEYKMPFSFSEDELKTFRYTNAQQGGFGVLFGGIFLVSMSLLVFVFILNLTYFKSKQLKKKIYITTAIVCLIIISCIINPIASLARYIPQGYIIPLIPAILFLSTKKKALNILGFVIVVMYLVNNFQIARVYYSYNMLTTKAIQNELKTLAGASASEPVKIKFNEFKSTRILLKDAKVNYIEVKEEDCISPQQFLMENTTKLCK